MQINLIIVVLVLFSDFFSMAAEGKTRNLKRGKSQKHKKKEKDKKSTKKQNDVEIKKEEQEHIKLGNDISSWPG